MCLRACRRCTAHVVRPRWVVLLPALFCLCPGPLPPPARPCRLSVACLPACAESRMAQELLRRHVLKVLRVWRGWYIFVDDFLNGLQATFLRASTGGGGDGEGAAPNEALDAELEALPDDELEIRCRRAGLSRKGGRGAQISRLLALDAYLNAGNEGRASARPAGQAGLDVPAPRAAVKPTSAWAAVDETPQPALPKSKWEQLDATAEQQQAPTSAARWGGEPAAAGGSADRAAPVADEDSDSDDDLIAAARRKQQPTARALELPNLVPHGADAPISTAPAAAAEAAALPAAADEERRARLRQVEVAVMQYREELEEGGGLSREAIEARAAERRAQLLGEAEAGGRQPPQASVPEPPSSSSRHQQRGRERDGPHLASRRSRRVQPLDGERRRARAARVGLRGRGRCRCDLRRGAGLRRRQSCRAFL